MEKEKRPIDLLPFWARLVFFGLLYLAGAELGVDLSFGGQSFSAFWPPAGLMLATLVLHHPRRWPAFFLIALVASLAFESTVRHHTLLVGAAFAVGNFLQGCFGAWLLQRLGGELRLSRVRGVVQLTGVAFVSPIVSAAICLMALKTEAPETHFSELWSLWWSADMMGILFISPAVLGWALRPGASSRPAAQRFFEGTALFAILALIAHLAFGPPGWLQLLPFAMPYPYITFPVLLWAAMRFSPRTCASAALLLVIITIYNTARGFGPLWTDSDRPRDAALLMQTFLFIIQLFALLPAAVMAQWRAADRDLKNLADTLDRRVTERTAELAESREQLERRVAERTAELTKLNIELESEMAERKRIADSQKRLVGIIEASTDFVGVSDLKGRPIYLNSAGRKMVGLAADSDLGLIANFHPEWAHEIVRKEGLPVAMLEGAWQGETALLHQDGREIPVSQVILSHKNEAGGVEFMSTVMRDMTERHAAEEEIRKSLAEKEVLLKEIHHRVKNNMQVVSSLLQLQSSYIRDPQTQEMFAESCDRIKSMALIHERLYQSRDLAAIDFGGYVDSLVSMIFASYRQTGSRIESRVRVDAQNMAIDTAIPLGLIINELVTNSLKYAFNGRDDGGVDVEVRALEENRYVLVVRDDGVGMPSNFAFDKAKSLGLRLVRILSKQIRGDISFKNGVGSEFRIEFSDVVHA